jgi:hypothetical protein
MWGAMGSVVIAIDPGLRCSGVSIWDDGVLMLACLVSSGLDTERGPKAWVAMARAVQAIYPLGVNHLVIETQQRDSRAFNPEAMLELAGAAGAIVGAYENRAKKHFGYKPRKWSRVPAEIRYARLREPNVLSKDEWTKVEPCSKHLEHNVLDALCLGLYHLKETRQR